MKRTLRSSNGGIETTPSSTAPETDRPIRKRPRTLVEDRLPPLFAQSNGIMQQTNYVDGTNAINVDNCRRCASVDVERQENLSKQTKLDSVPGEKLRSMMEETEETNYRGDQMLSEEEKATRAVMVQLATGIRKGRKLDPVDSKLEQLIRTSRFKALDDAGVTIPHGARQYSRSSSDISMDEDDCCLEKLCSNLPQQHECITLKSSMSENTMDIDFMADG